MKVGKRGRTWESGKSISIDLRRAIIDEIVLAGGDIVTGNFPGCYEQIATKFCVARITVRKIWKRYVEEFSENPLPKSGGVQGKLSEYDLALIEALRKVQRGSFMMKETCAELDDIGDVEESVSLSTISRSLQKLPSGKVYTRKKITHIAKERFTRENMIYTQLFLNYVNSKNPYTLKFFFMRLE
ncbi:transcriptional regulator [Paramuricea clavata]|uniref:Transcriptional regulator n=1 Tax=Paramuricea clavata TaxID=317549 RepID=A0A6S7FRR8_PARCT|nr:transcriptional regulator [Paramuricea clavata]